MPTLNRRDLLAGLAGTGTALLAGCPACAHSVLSHDDRLLVDVTRIRATAGEFSGVVSVTHDVEASQVDGTPTGGAGGGTESTPSTGGTHYEGVVVHGYTHEGTEAFAVDAGEFPLGRRAAVEFEAADFPVVVTASVDGYEQPSCYYADVGQQVRGYLGQFPEGADAGPRGETWLPLGFWGERDRPLPLSRYLETIKCRQRAAVQNEPDRPLVPGSEEHRPTPDLSLVSGHDRWTGEPIPAPTVRHLYSFSYGGPASDYRHQPRLGTFVPFADCPMTVQEVVRGFHLPHLLNRKPFLAAVGRLEGRSLDNPADLPACDAANVRCEDDRRLHCTDGATYEGTYRRFLYYHTEYEGAIHPFAAEYRKRWIDPRARGNLPPCGDTYVEEFTADLSLGLRVRGEREAVDVPQRLVDAIETRSQNDVEWDDDQVHIEFERGRAWLDVLSVLEGRRVGAVPTCDWSNVDCQYKEPGQSIGDLTETHCGKGRRHVIYFATIDGERWSITLRYEWKRLREGTEAAGEEVDWFH